MSDIKNPTSAGEEVVRCYKEVVIRGERCRCVLPDLHSFLCEMQPASPPPSGPSSTIATADLPLTMPDAFGDNRFHDWPLTRVAPPSARPADLDKLVEEVKACFWVSLSNSIVMGTRGEIHCNEKRLREALAAPKSSTLGEARSQDYVWAGSDPFTGAQVLDLLRENEELRSGICAKCGKEKKK